MAMNMGMDVKIEKGRLIISMPIQEPSPSSSGKTLIVATSGGNQPTEVKIKGKTLKVGVNAFISND